MAMRQFALNIGKKFLKIAQRVEWMYGPTVEGSEQWDALLVAQIDKGSLSEDLEIK